MSRTDAPLLGELDRASFRARRDDLLDVYAEAMHVDRRAAGSRRSILAAHEDREGLVTIAATDTDDRLVGIAYGYLGRPGQWWYDQVHKAMSAEQVDSWLAGAFEVCELHVRPALHGTGLGRALLEALLARTDAPTAVLTTPDEVETRARRFYRAAGWVELVRALRFPGDRRTFAVLGLPLAERAETPSGQ